MIAALAALVAGGCSKQDDTLEETQRTSFTNYLKGQQYAYTEQSGVYRYITNTDREGYGTAPVLDGESSAVIDLSLIHI